jgi:hypothetical protein
MKITLLPSSRLGKITLYLLGLSILLWIVMIALSSSMQMPFETAFDPGGNLLLGVFIIGVTASAVLCFFTGILAIIFKKDLAVTVILATLIGANMLFTLIMLVYRVPSLT